ncbi:Glypican-1 Secreted glypican-1 [Collichthys lucidus]|uniref:Glypican-1 n=1 Tax=Collichthys lucidus TaxID=240159 RepID=A0A4U5UYL7_COLLU|nr:Glypican-1 Secreted glypican-1 [Collichthys lucidus]
MSNPRTVGTCTRADAKEKSSVPFIFPFTDTHKNRTDLRTYALLQVQILALDAWEHLRICAQGYTCCTSDVEDNLAMLSRREMEGLLREAGRSLQTSLTGHYKAFDRTLEEAPTKPQIRGPEYSHTAGSGPASVHIVYICEHADVCLYTCVCYFIELLNRSAVILQETFTSTWGITYLQNSQVFSDLYTELRQYYRGSNVNLEEVLNEFWAKLLEKLFHQANKQYFIGEDYLECVSKKIDTLRPFGDTPRLMKTTVMRTFVASRFFVQGLVVSGEVVRKVSQFNRHMMLLCSVNTAETLYRCTTYEPFHAFFTLTVPPVFVETLIQVADHFDGPSGVDSVILSLPYRISEGIVTMSENLQSINSKLFQACGVPQEGGTGSTGVDDMKKGKVIVEDKLGSSSSKMDKLVSDVTMNLRELQPYWVSLPSVLCSDRVATGTGAEEKCWNGMSRARYLPEVIGDGLASQINNPEVEIDITKPDMTIRQQIMQLKMMTHRLKNALNGQDVDFQDTSDDVSGSGSGLCPDGGSCSRSPGLIVPATDQPIIYQYPPENEKNPLAGCVGSTQESVVMTFEKRSSCFYMMARQYDNDTVLHYVSTLLGNVVGDTATHNCTKRTPVILRLLATSLPFGSQHFYERLPRNLRWSLYWKYQLSRAKHLSVNSPKLDTP